LFLCDGDGRALGLLQRMVELLNEFDHPGAEISRLPLRLPGFQGGAELRVTDIGIEPVFFDAVGYNSSTDAYEVDSGAPLRTISGTEVRETLWADAHLPDWFMRDIVQEALLEELHKGNPLFVE